MVDRLFSDPDLAALYDPLCPREQRADFDFYLPLVMVAPSVLDVGCGTGAMLHEARRLGHAGGLCGLDPAPGMLTQARKGPNIEWVLGNLASVTWEREFDLVVMTGHAFQVLIGDDELRSSLSAIRSALTENGRFAFETRNPLVREWENWRPENAVEVTDAHGKTVRVQTQVETPFDGNTVSFTHTFTSLTWDQPKVSRSTLRFLSVDALSALLAETGFTIEEQFGNWDRQPLASTSPEIITIARRGSKLPAPCGSGAFCH
jgi:SAM-dependent methyltransferase